MRALGCVLAIVALAAPARAEKRRNRLLRWVTCCHGVLVTTDAGRWETGGGVSSGWRSLVDLHARYYARHRTSIGARLRLDVGDAEPRAVELELARAIAKGNLWFPVGLDTRTRLVIEAGGGVTRVDQGILPTGFIGLGWRIQPSYADWLLVDLRVRGLVAPEPLSYVPRATSPPPSNAYGFSIETGIAIAVLWPASRTICRGYSDSID